MYDWGLALSECLFLPANKLKFWKFREYCLSFISTLQALRTVYLLIRFPGIVCPSLFWRNSDLVLT